MNEAKNRALTKRQRDWLDHLQTCAASGMIWQDFSGQIITQLLGTSPHSKMVPDSQ